MYSTFGSCLTYIGFLSYDILAYHYDKPYICYVVIYCMEELKKDPLRRAHFIGTSVVVTIDRCHVKRLGNDDVTFFIEKPIENGILLEMRKLNTSTAKENNVK